MQITTRGPQTAADWTAQNPVLDQFEIGIEVNPATGAYEKAKIGDGRTAWASLGYWNPAGSTGGGGALTLATVTVDATVGTKQDLLAAVGASTNQIVADATFRNASESLAAITGGNGVSLGYNAGATDVVAGAAVDGLTTSELNVSATIASPGATGVSGDVLGLIVDPIIPPPDVTVAGAGTAAADGVYVYSAPQNGRPQYNHPVTGQIYWNGVDRWEISDGDPYWYYSLDDVATPALCTTWVADVDGSNPVPTVTEGANPTFDVDVLYYDVAI